MASLCHCSTASREIYAMPEEKDIVIEEETVQAHNATLGKILQENKPNPWGKGYRRLYAICALVYLCSTMNGMQKLIPLR
jgi:hypothetical protein